MTTKDILPPELQQLVNGLVEELKALPYNQLPNAIECITRDSAMQYAMHGMMENQAKSQFYAGILTGILTISEVYQARLREVIDGQTTVQA